MDFSASLSDKYKAIDAAFKATAEVRRGELNDYSNAKVVCFTRSIPGKTMLVAVNTTGQSQSVRVPISLAGSSMSDMLNGGSVTLSYTAELEPYRYIILSN